jgi:hypothetical protein
MIVYITYNAENRNWDYYYEDSQGYKTITQGFRFHIDAKEYATKILGKDITVIVK